MVAKQGGLESLEGRSSILGTLMLEHAQYQYFWELPAVFARERAKEAIGEQTGVDCDLHISVEADVLEQIEAKDPPEVYKAYAALQEIGLDPHEARHAIARIVGEVMRGVSSIPQGGKPPSKNAYIRRLRQLARHPEEVYNEQIGRLEENP